MTHPDPTPAGFNDGPRRGAAFLNILDRLTDHNRPLGAQIRRRHPHAVRLARTALQPRFRLDTAENADLDAAHDHLILTVTTAVHPAVVAPILGLPPAHTAVRARNRRVSAA